MTTLTKVRQLPILMAPDLSQKAALGLKTQTRRLIKPQPTYNAAHPYRQWEWKTPGASVYWADDGKGSVCLPDHAPYLPGDFLLVCCEIPGTDGNYAAGSDGRIFNRHTKRPLSAHIPKKGYPTVALWYGGRKHTTSVHRAVCTAFYGPRPAGAEVRHLDGNPLNGRPDNLAWGTRLENWQDRKAHGNGCAGGAHHLATFADEDRAHIRWAIEKGLTSQKHAARMLGCSPSQIQQMLGAKELVPAAVTDPGQRISETWLEVTRVRAERIQDITTEDARSEGYISVRHPASHFWMTPVDAFRSSWSKRYPGSWDRNDWVFVYDFEKVEAPHES